MTDKALIKIDEFQKEIRSFTSFLDVLKETPQGEARGEMAYMLEKAGEGWALLGERSLVGLGQICYLAREGWEFLPEDWKENYLNEKQENDWRIFARKVSKGRADSTVANYITVYETWFSGNYQFDAPTQVVYKTKDGVEIVEEKAFNPWDTAPSKLLMCASRAKKGKMREKDWQALADPETSWGSLQRVLLDRETHDPSGKKLPTITFVLQATGVFAAERNGESAELGLLLNPSGKFAEEAYSLLCDLIGLEIW